MPRDGSGIYTKPYPNVVSGTTIESAVHNGTVSDIETDLNAVRPIIAGGTGASSAVAARTNLKAEVSAQQVTNYDTHVWEAGSFYSTPGATGEPVATRYVSGVCHLVDANAITLEAIAYDSPTQIYGRYTRTKWTTWGPWVRDADVASDDARYVNVTGDTMTGDLYINTANSNLLLNGQNPGVSRIVLKNNNSDRWYIQSDHTVGSNFNIYAFTDAGALAYGALSIERSTGHITVAGNITTPGAIYIDGALNTKGSVIARDVTIGQTYNLDAAQNGVTVAGSALICIIWNFSGMVIVNSHGGPVDLFLCGGGSITRVGSVGGTAANPAFAGAQNGYAFYNAGGSTTTFGIATIRTRVNA